MNKLFSSVFWCIVLLSCNDYHGKQDTFYCEVMLNALEHYDIDSTSNREDFFLIEETTVLLDSFTIRAIIRHKKEVISESNDRSELLDKLLNEKIQLPVQECLPMFRHAKGNDGNYLGLIQVSNIVLHGKDSSDGLFFYKYLCGGECGSANLVFIKEFNGKWRVSEVYPLYIL